jgi:hypothetical protein
MARDKSLRRFWFAQSRTASSTAAFAREGPRLAEVEALESRSLLSATINPGGPNIPVPTPTPAVVAIATGHGVTLDLSAGEAFSGYLGDLVGAKVPAGYKLGATINWADGSTPGAGVASIGSTGNIDVAGSHTYASGGTYPISITVTATPAPSGPVNEPIILYLGSISSRAIVNSSGSVTLDEKAGTAFTASVGTFSYPAPAGNLHANISWGDGIDSVGTITATGVSGVDVINFKVTGTHTYARAGTYPILVTVGQSAPAAPIPLHLITTIDSTAYVTAAGLNLDGTITGTLIPAPTAVNVGALYILSDGTGSVQAMGAVSAAGRIQLPPLMSSGPASGTLTLTTISATAKSPSGSVTLKLTGPTQKGSDPIPAAVSYVITSGTGNFAYATGSGTIDITLDGDLGYKFVIQSA